MRERQASPRESVGRLLRLIQDSELFHVEYAIEAHKLKQQQQQQSSQHLSDVEDDSGNGVQLTTSARPGGRAAIEIVGATDNMASPPTKKQERLLTLADHKRITNLQLVLDAIEKATVSIRAARTEQQAGSGDHDAQRNMLSALTSALITQTMNNCSATKENYCVWKSEAKKHLTLLHWMATNRAGDCVVAELLLTWISPENTSDKSQHMAGALVLFELIQRHRRRIIASTAEPVEERESSSASLLGSISSEFVRQLIDLTKQGSIFSAPDNSAHRLKLTKLGLVALEALVAVLCDQAAWLSETRQLSSSLVTQVFLEGVDVAIRTLQQYHTASSSRKQFLLLALDQLDQYTMTCRSIRGRQTSSEVEGAFEMLCWHWNASAIFLCSRSDAVLKIRKVKPFVALKTEIGRWSADGNGSNNVELLAARLRRLCVLLSFAFGSRGNTLLNELSRDLEVRGKLLIVLVRTLKMSIRQRNEQLGRFVTQTLRALVFTEQESGGQNQEARPKQLLETEEDCQALLSLLLRTLKSAIEFFGAKEATTVRSLLLPLENMIADFGVQSSGDFLLTDLQRSLRSTDFSSMLAALNLIPIIFDRLEGSDPWQREMLGMWRRQLSPVLADVLARQDTETVVLQEALLCAPLLEVAYLSRLFASLSDGIEVHISTVGLTLLFAFCDRQEALEQITSAFIDLCRNCATAQPDALGSRLTSPSDWTRYTHPSAASTEEHSTHIQQVQELQERVLSLSSSSSGWIRAVKSPEKRIRILKILLRKLFGAPRDPFSLRFLRELVAAGWIEAGDSSSGDETTVFMTVLLEVTRQMKSLTRLSEKLLGDRASAVEALLFARLAPVLVLRVLPRACFLELGHRRLLHCDQEDVSHLEEAFIKASDIEDYTVDRDLFHLLVLQVVDPLEFKEVKMLAAEILAKLPPSSVTPVVFAHLLAFLREETPMLAVTPFTEALYEPALFSLRIPGYCGIITAKLMVYYLNRVINEDLGVFKDKSQVPFILAILLQVLSIPADEVISENNSERNLLADLQMGCMDCVALLILRNLGNPTAQASGKTAPDTSGSLLDVLMDRIIFDNAITFADEEKEPKKPSELMFAVEMMLLSLVSSAPQHTGDLSLPLQVRICGCNILLSVIGRLDATTFSAFKASRAIPRLLATVSTSNTLREEIVAGSLQVLFTFVYKTGDALSVKDTEDLQLVDECLVLVLEKLESSSNQQVCMNALKVVGAVMGKLPDFFGAISEERYRHLIRSLQSVRERSASVAKTVSDFAQSLLNALIVQ